MAIQGCRELELEHSTFSGRSVCQPADQELSPDTPVCNQAQGPVITVCTVQSSHIICSTSATSCHICKHLSYLHIFL